jgi:hypothetical protein
MASEPETPDERIPQDPGTSGLPSEEEPERPEPTKEETGTDAQRRLPRHRAD